MFVVVVSPTSVTHNGEWDTTNLVSRTTDLSDLSESRLTCKASLTHNPTPFIIQDDAWPWCGVNPYSNVLSSDTDGASFDSMQHEEIIML